MIHPELPQKAIAIRQPWAWAIVHGSKRIENRTWRTKFRGPVCIHASKVLKQSEIDAYNNAVWSCSLPKLPEDAQPLGGIIGVAEIVDCVDASDSKWFFGPHGFVLTNVRAVPFIPVKGALGFFDWRTRTKEAT